MKKEERLWRALGDVDEDLLAAAEGAGRNAHRLRRAAAVSLAAALALGCIAAAAGLIPWDRDFLDNLRPTDAVVEQMAGAVDGQVVTSNCGDVTLTVRQTIGVPGGVYVLLDVRLSADVFPVEDQENVELRSLRAYEAASGYDQIEGLDYWHAEELFQTAGTLDYSCYELKREERTKTVTYLLNLRAGDGDLSGRPVTLLFRKASLFKPLRVYENGLVETEELAVCKGPFLISWTPQYEGTGRQFHIQRGEVTGTVSLTHLSLSVEFEHMEDAEYRSIYEKNDILLTDREGRTCRPAVGSGGYGGGQAQIFASFDQAIDLERLATIQIGSYVIDVEP